MTGVGVPGPMLWNTKGASSYAWIPLGASTTLDFNASYIEIILLTLFAMETLVSHTLCVAWHSLIMQKKCIG